ncbi:hypothetical protein CLPUN_12510 [Clostridium puniceum]|uniref:Uncharacterized protein n=1 Tax=Clostridium puniceum TaxID=29367 RepID=A0A1S8TTC7_9CLOT|nr:Tad domain-containing protein [Clostridium puniceum]OOM80585.1 hypothetical protein CLPUN_12510 [Clostridium puniceum]
MKCNFKNNKGNTLVLVCAALPMLIGVIGLCIDGSLMVYYQTRLMAATKFAAVSASSHNKIVQEKTIINATEDQVRSALIENFSQAKLISFTINPASKNKCTVIAETEVNFVFMKMFLTDSKDYKKTIRESYDVTRK